jgi:hypothetical protein
MNSNKERGPVSVRWRRGQALLTTLTAAPGGWRDRLANRISSSGARSMKRQMRRWLAANGLTIVLVSAIMIIAWIIAER